jgi:hypothetical protein
LRSALTAKIREGKQFFAPLHQKKEKGVREA